MDLGGDGYTPFERALLHAVFNASSAAAAIFREQVAKSRVTNRRFSGSGSFTDIEVDRAAPTALGVCGTPAEQQHVAIWRPGMEAEAGCVVFVDGEGYINCLEVYSFGSAQWADDPTEWRILSGQDASASKNPFDD
jgi:hypothetical protein